jgi:hypothetical protein
MPFGVSESRRASFLLRETPLYAFQDRSLLLFAERDLVIATSEVRADLVVFAPVYWFVMIVG